MEPQSAASRPPLARVTAYCIAAASAAVLAMMVIATADVVGTVFNHPIGGAFELVAMLMVLVVFLGLPEAEGKNLHISVDLVYARLPSSAQWILSIVNGLITLAFFGAMAWQGWKLFWDSWSIREYAAGQVGFPVYPAKGLYAFGVSVAVVVIFVKLVRLLRARPGDGSPPFVDRKEGR